MKAATARFADVVDSRAARMNQLLVIVSVVAAYFLNAPWLVLGVAVVVVGGALAGERYVLGYRLYFLLVQPLVGVGRTEDARAPRFAQLMGGSGMTVGAALIYLGFETAGWITALGLSAAAGSSVVWDWCVGCKTYELIAHLRGRSPRRLARIDPTAVDLPALASDERAIVELMHPACHACQQWRERLESGDEPFVIVDVGERPELADAYGVMMVPTVFEVDSRGRVTRWLAP